MIKASELASAARARHHDNAEGFLDNTPVIYIEIPEAYIEQFEALADDLAQLEGVSLELAQETIVQEALKRGFDLNV